MRGQFEFTVRREDGGNMVVAVEAESSHAALKRIERTIGTVVVTDPPWRSAQR